MNFKRILKNTIWMGISRIGIGAVKFITVPMLLHYYGKEQFGLIALTLALNGYLQILAMGLPSGIVRFVAIKLGGGDEKGLGRLSGSGMTMYLIIGVLNALILGSFALWGLQVFNVSEIQILTLRTLVIISAISSFFFWIGSYLDQLLGAAEEIAWRSKLQGFQAVLELGVVLFITRSGLHFGVEIYFILLLVCMHLMTPLKLVRWRKHITLRKSLRPCWDWKTFRPVCFYSVWMMLFAIIRTSSVELRPLLLGANALDGAGAAAEYRILLGITQFVLMTYGWVATPLLPAVSKAYGSGNKAIAGNIIVGITRPVWAVLGIILFGFLSCSKPLLILYVGEEYAHLSGALDSWLLALSVNLFLGPTAVAVMATGRVKALVSFTVVSSLTSLTMLWWLADSWGLQAAVAATLLYNVLQFVFYIVFIMPKLIPGSAFIFVLKDFVPVMMVGLACGYLPRWLISYIDLKNTMLQLLMCGGVFCVLYLTGIFMMIFPFWRLRQEIQKIRQIVTEGVHPV